LLKLWLVPALVLTLLPADGAASSGSHKSSSKCAACPRDSHMKRVASAVGEGSNAIAFVHRVLSE
jgi:hypothetical protein